MSLLEWSQTLLNGYQYKTKHICSILNTNKGLKIELTEKYKPSRFEELFTKIFESFDAPVYVHSYYGYIWEKNGEYLALNVIEEYYQIDTIVLYLFNKLPKGNKLTYIDYTEMVDNVKHVLANHQLSICEQSIYYNAKAYLFLAESPKNSCLISIKRKRLTFYYSKKEQLGNDTTRICPLYTRKRALHLCDSMTVRQALENCFIAE